MRRKEKGQFGWDEFWWACPIYRTQIASPLSKQYTIVCCHKAKLWAPWRQPSLNSLYSIWCLQGKERPICSLVLCHQQFDWYCDFVSDLSGLCCCVPPPDLTNDLCSVFCSNPMISLWNPLGGLVSFEFPAYHKTWIPKNLSHFTPTPWPSLFTSFLFDEFNSDSQLTVKLLQLQNQFNWNS